MTFETVAVTYASIVYMQKAAAEQDTKAQRSVKVCPALCRGIFSQDLTIEVLIIEVFLKYQAFSKEKFGEFERKAGYITNS